MLSFCYRPISLNCIRDKMDPNNIHHYQTIQAFIEDCKLLFSNAKQFYEVSLNVNKLNVIRLL